MAEINQSIKHYPKMAACCSAKECACAIAASSCIHSSNTTAAIAILKKIICDYQIYSSSALATLELPSDLSSLLSRYLKILQNYKLNTKFPPNLNFENFFWGGHFFLGAIPLRRVVVPSPKIVIILSRTYEN